MAWRPSVRFSLSAFFSVTATSASKDILEALAAARKEGKPYAVGFSTAGASKHREEGDGSNAARSCSEAEPQTGNEPRDQQGGEGEALREGLEVGSDEPEAGADGGMGEEGGRKDGEGRREGPEGAEGAGRVGEEEAEGLQEEQPEAGSGDGEVTLMYEMYDEKFPIKVTDVVQISQVHGSGIRPESCCPSRFDLL